MAGLLILIKFSVFIAGFVYLPGFLFLKIFFKKDNPAMEQTVTALVLGILVNTELYNILSLFGQQRIFPLVIFIAACCGLYFHITRYRDRVGIPEGNASAKWIWIAVLIQLFFIVSNSWFKSGLWYGNGLRFYAPVYDATCHLSIIGEISKPRPYQYPNFAGEFLRGYHYGSDQFISIVNSLTGIDIMHLFYRLMPLFLVPLAMLTVFIGAGKFLKDKRAGLIAVIFVFFVGDLTWLVNLFSKNPVSVIALDFETHPATVFGAILFLTGLYFLIKRNIIIAGFAWGMAFKFAAYYAPVILASLFLSVFLNKDRKLSFKFFIAALLFSFYAYLQVGKLGQTQLFKLYPGYFWIKLISGIFQFNARGAELLSYPPVKIAGLLLLGFFTYNFIMLGIKVLALPEFIKRLHFKRITARESVFCELVAIVSFLAANLFIRTTRGMHNTSFFLEPFLLIFGIYAACVCARIVMKTDLKKTWLLLVLIIFGLGGTFLKIYSRIAGDNNSYMLISAEEYEAAAFLRKNMLSSEVVMHFRKNMPWYSERRNRVSGESHRHRQLFISSLTGKRVLLEGASFTIETGGIKDIWDKLREREYTGLLETKDWKAARDKLKRFSVSYIWLERGEKFAFNADKTLKKIFGNKRVSIYKVR